MPGMLEQGMPQQAPQGMAPQQPVPQPSSGPPVQTPPSPPLQGDPGGAPGPEHSAPAAPQGPPQTDFPSLRDQAIKLVYGERFEQLIKMFETNGPEKFARSMAIAVNTPITELEKNGPIDYQTATKVGMAIYMRLLEDMLGGGVVEGVTAEQVSETLPAILIMYSESHPEVTKEQITSVVMNAHQGVKQTERGSSKGNPAEGVLPGIGGAA